ncbi:MAG TPA: hypothetical protein VFV25_01770, partial [Methylibium sp.]
MNAWVLQQAGSDAQALDAQLSACDRQMAQARSAGDGERLRLLTPRRLMLGKALTALLRPVRARHRAALRQLFFGRIGKTTTTLTYQLRCDAVKLGLGWATANAVLDSALLAWEKSLVLGRAPR